MTIQSETPVAVAAAALADEAIGKIEKAGEGFARADADRSLSLHLFIGAVGEKPTFEQWESARKAAIAGYRKVKPQATDDAANVWWSRFVAAARTYAGEAGFDFALPTKPKSASPEAIKKAEARANPLQGKTLDEVRKIKAEAAEALKAAPTQESIKAMSQAIEAEAKLVKAEAEARAKAAKTQLQPRIDALRKWISGADMRTITVAEALRDAMDQTAKPEAREAAWDVLRTVVPARIDNAKADKARKAA